METAAAVVMEREWGGLFPELLAAALMHVYTQRLFLEHVPWSLLKGTYQAKSNFPWSFQIQVFLCTVDITFKLPSPAKDLHARDSLTFEFDVKKWGKIHYEVLDSVRSFWNQVGIQQIVIPNCEMTNAYIGVCCHKSSRPLKSVDLQVCRFRNSVSSQMQLHCHFHLNWSTG